MKRRRSLIGFVLIVLLLSGAVALSLAVLPRERLLLRQAQPLCSVSGWIADDTTSHAHVDETHYHWLSDGVVFYETEAAEYVRLQQLDTRTGKVQQSTGLLERQKRYPVDAYSFTLSPDRQWALWQTPQRGYSLNIVARVDGSVSHVWKSPHDRIHARYIDTQWLGQEHRCVELIADLEALYNRAIFRSAENLQSVTGFPIGEHSRFNDNGLSSLGHTTVAAGHAFRYNYGFDPATGKMEIDDIDLTQSPWLEQQHWLTLPTDADVYALYFHPRQKRMAVLMAYPGTVPLSAFLHRLLPHMSIQTQWRLGLWVVDWQGTHLHEIGHIPIPKSDVFTSPITQVAWLPDDTHLSFIYQGVLYKVSDTE